ncbi:prepilin-type N-terminal cleavage/methylation domain-containing protein, partial [bacterium]|nr:prepilin-type N-terminal cleavage/methylation domain-containing protein [bacterium]
MTLSSGFAPHAPKARARRAGFSLIELLVGVVLAFVLLAAILSLFNAYNTSVLREEQRVEVQQAGRNSIRLIRDDLELVGADVVRERGQAAMVFAAPWEVVFNANIDDTYGELADGVTMPHGGADSPYTGSAYESDAETIRYWTGQPDATTRDFSVHSSDRVIYKKVNDHDKAVLGYGVRYDDGTIPYRDGSHVAPLFSFWGDFDFDESTPPTLWGDTSGDGALSNAEREALFKGEFSWSYQGPTGTINVGNTPGGAVYLNRVGGQPSNRENDDNGNGQLDASEDLNRNGRFDTNLLDSAITRVDLNVTVISQFGEPLVTLDRGEQFREYAVSTTVAPRNLGAPPSKDCGGAPGPPTNAAAAIQDCGYGISVSWNRSADDGLNDNDVMWYEVFRKIESSTSPHEWVFHAFVPATNSASYTYLDANVYKEPIYGDVDPDPLVERIELIGYDFPDHQYRIQAVDCGDSHSGPSDSNTVSPTTTFPTNPPEIALWDTPCFIPSSPASMTEGSITVMWTASTDAQVDEYWIYRSDPNITTEVNGYEIARVDIADVNSACATAAGSLIQAEKQCVNEDFYRWGTTYVWRDQPGSPGRNAVAPPINGRSFGLSDGGYGAGGSPSGSGFDEEDMAKYTYEVKSYRSNDECLSTGLRYVSACDNYNEAQSYNCYDDTALPPGRFSPPWNVLVYDTSVYDSDGTVDPAMTVYWDASPSQFCESSGSPNNDIPDLSRYYVYRSKQPMTYDGFTGRLQRVILREDSTAPFDPTGEVNVFDATQKIIVFKGVPRADATFVYSYEDTPDII